MFALSRTYDGLSIPLDMVYLDALGGAATLTGITLQATQSGDTLTASSQITAMFENTPLPLSGADFLTPVTGALTLTADTTALPSGIYLFSLFSTSGRWQGLGRVMWSSLGFGIAGRLRQRVAPLLYVSVYALTATVPTTPPTVPTSAWR